MARLLEQAVALRLGLAQLLRRIAIRVCEKFTGFVPGCIQHLCALALALLAVALDLRLAILLLASASAHLLFGFGQLSLGCLLRVGLDGVGEFGSRANQMQRIHPYRVPGGLDGLPTSAR